MLGAGYFSANLSLCEGATCIGIDLQPAFTAPDGELFRIHYSSDDEVAEALCVADLFVRTGKPLPVCRREGLRIVHDAEKRCVICFLDPADADVKRPGRGLFHA